MLPPKVDPFTYAVRSDVDGHDKPVPLRCVTGPPGLVDSVHPAGSAAPTRHVVHRANQQPPHVG